MREATPSNDDAVADTSGGILAGCTLEGLVRRGRPGATNARLLDIFNHPCWDDGHFHNFLAVVVELNDQRWHLTVR